MKLTTKSREAILQVLRSVKKRGINPDEFELNEIEDILEEDDYCRALRDFSAEHSGSWALDRNPQQVTKDWIDENSYRIKFDFNEASKKHFGNR